MKFLENLKIFFAGALAALVLRVLNLTLRWTEVKPAGEDDWATETPRIIVFWHGDQLFMPWLYRRNLGKKPRKMFVLISQHSDGRIIALAMRFLGIFSVAGSSTRGGAEALFALVDVLRNGDHISVTPDGPKGPLHKLKSGVTRIAQRSGAPVYPCGVAFERAWTLGSWDKMIIPKPFSRAVVVMGDPIHVPAKLEAGELERWTQVLEDCLNAAKAVATSFDFERSRPGTVVFNAPDGQGADARRRS